MRWKHATSPITRFSNVTLDCIFSFWHIAFYFFCRLNTSCRRSHSFCIEAACLATKGVYSEGQIRALGRWQSPPFKIYSRCVGKMLGQWSSPRVGDTSKRLKFLWLETNSYRLNFISTCYLINEVKPRCMTLPLYDAFILKQRQAMSDWTKFCVFPQQMKMRFHRVFIAAVIVEYAVSRSFSIFIFICNMVVKCSILLRK